MRTLLIASFTVVLLICCSWRVLNAERRSRIGSFSPVTSDMDSTPPSTESFVVPGIVLPELCPANLAHVADMSPVIGIVVDGEPRAYLRDALEVFDVTQWSELSAHVINDVVGNTAVTVTHCNLKSTTRVFTSDSSNVSEAAAECTPLDIAVGGWDDGMLLVVGSTTYEQMSPELPVVDIPFVATSWKEWLAMHPDTLVFTGYGCLERDEIR